MDAHRKRHAPSLRVADAAGNTAGLVAPLTSLVDILYTDPWGLQVGVATSRSLRGGLGSETSVARWRRERCRRTYDVLHAIM